MDLGPVLANWLHTVAFVIAVGYYGILGLVVIPGLRALESGIAATTLDAIERRALPLIVIATIAFVATGGYLLATDSQYQGVGNLVGSTWTGLLTLKHVFVVGLVGLAMAIDYFIKSAGDAPDDRSRRARIFRVQVAADAALVLGAVIVLVTVIAQAS